MNTRGRIVGAALALMLGLAPVALGQDAGPKDVRKIYTRNVVFKLPVQMDEKERAELTGLKLFVRAMPGGWECRETAPATQREFSFRAPQDGEYWFSFATVDKSGAVSPANPDQEPPGLIVIVDTRAPEISLRALPTSPGPGFLQCKLNDANPDYGSVKMEYGTNQKDGLAWQALEPVTDTVGVFAAPNPSVLSGWVRVRAGDRAGNVAERIINLGESRAPAAVVQASAPGDAAPAAKSAALPPGHSAPIVIPAAATTDRPAPPAMPSDDAPKPASPVSIDQAKSDPQPLPTSLTGPGKDVPSINTLKCNMAISVESPADGVTKVELWATTDSGKTWALVGQSLDGKRAVQAEFPREGLYGYTFVVKSAASAGQPPAAGDTPDGWVDVDTTKPVAEALSATLGVGDDAGHLLITWVAQDRNFGPEPISLYTASQPGGPWQPLAEKLANTGKYRWPLPKNLGGRLFVRLEAADRAGNVTVCDFPAPVQLETVRAKVKVLSVTPAGKE